ncbi:MmcQ/YjbR family DNA-binding protein [Hominiventricola filiformis]|uniref:MmcQ/YjbR family DNA-binding protein n=1 Tax=Hominiventricola filiformis TaxID=2885352 RepID=A0AAE3DDR9_9FIRM|nr:MmcQ/YjbR family DNA-binding protein [Hominiventricola filiformis]MCC2127564.1 MmcQ/YjbR family DNA-binding protein [Hominiventricola filiformis]
MKSDPLLIGSLRGQDGYFPAYHMNKEKWLSIQLGKPELDDAIKDLLSLSYELTAPKKRKPKSSAKNPGDFANGKEKETDEG